VESFANAWFNMSRVDRSSHDLLLDRFFLRVTFVT
jgi:hypothetical protein